MDNNTIILTQDENICVICMDILTNVVLCPGRRHYMCRECWDKSTLHHHESLCPICKNVGEPTHDPTLQVTLYCGIATLSSQEAKMEHLKSPCPICIDKIFTMHEENANALIQQNRKLELYVDKLMEDAVAVYMKNDILKQQLDLLLQKHSQLKRRHLNAVRFAKIKRFEECSV